MRILYHHRTLADGAEGIHIGAMIDAFRALGHDVLLEGVTPGQSDASRPRFVGRIRSLIPQTGFELASLAYNAREHRRIGHVIRKFRPAFLYSRHARFGGGAVDAARKAGVPSVLEVNCLFTQGAYQRFEPVRLAAVAASMERRALQLATSVVAVSTPLADQIRSLAQRPVAVLPNGADPERFDPAKANPDRVRARHHLAGQFVVGWSGILREWHGLDLLVAAVAQLPAARLLIVGDGPARPALERLASEHGCADRLVITGRVSHSEMPDYMAAMDAAVVAGERTGVASPMKLLEYMAMGRAVVAPHLPNIADIVNHEADGLLFTVGDAEGLAGTLRRLAHDTALRNRLGLAARSKVLTARNWQAIAQEVLAGIERP